METMKILQVTEPGGPFGLIEAPLPQPRADEVVLRVEAVTTCPQWDMHLKHNEPMFIGHLFAYPYTPGQPGHEATGTIAALGEGVTDLSVGQRVSAWRDPGHTRPGCYAQYVLLSAANVIPVPAELPYAATAPVELAMCVGAVFLMLREMNALRGRRVGITGLGPAGLIAAQMARAEGASEVIGFDLSAERREYAKTFAVDAAYDSRNDLSERFPARPAKPMLDAGIDCVGAKCSVEFLMDRVRETVALFGVQREEYTFAPRHYSLRLCGYPGHYRAAAEYAVGLIAGEKLNLLPLVTHHLPLSRYAEGIALLERQEAIKVCFYPWENAPEATVSTT
jgi:threonine dehydrogenase-like Zn-dependent dehydrogenase